MTDDFSNQFKHLRRKRNSSPVQTHAWSSKLANQKRKLAQNWSVKEMLPPSWPLRRDHNRKEYFWKYVINQLSVCVCERAMNAPSGTNYTHYTLKSPPPQVLDYKYRHLHTCATSLPLSCWFSPLASWSDVELRVFSQCQSLCLWTDETHSNITRHPWVTLRILSSFQMKHPLTHSPPFLCSPGKGHLSRTACLSVWWFLSETEVKWT